MESFVRIARFLTAFGVLLIILSFTSPIVSPSFTPIGNLNYGEYKGIMVNCYDTLNIRIESRHEELFSVYLTNSTNGLLAMEEGSLENVTVLFFSLNKTTVDEHLSIPVPGYYSVLVTPSANETIELLYLEFQRQSPNQRVILTGCLLILVAASWLIGEFRHAIKRH